jgi:hypothetical protein
MSVTVDTSGHIYYDDVFSRLLFLHVHREVSVLDNELHEESDQFRYLRTDCLVNLKGSAQWDDFDENIGHENFYTV